MRKSKFLNRLRRGLLCPCCSWEDLKETYFKRRRRRGQSAEEEGEQFHMEPAQEKEEARYSEHR